MATRKELQEQINNLKLQVLDNSINISNNSKKINTIEFKETEKSAKDKGLHFFKIDQMFSRGSNYYVMLNGKNVLDKVSYKTARDFVNAYTPVETQKKVKATKKPAKKTKKK